MVNWAAVATVFVLPVSFLWDLVAFWRLQLNFWWRLYLGAGQNNHEDKVRRVQKQVGTLTFLFYTLTLVTLDLRN